MLVEDEVSRSAGASAPLDASAEGNATVSIAVVGVGQEPDTASSVLASTSKVSKCGTCRLPKVLHCKCMCDRCGKGKRSSLPTAQKCGCGKMPQAPASAGGASGSGAVAGAAAKGAAKRVASASAGKKPKAAKEPSVHLKLRNLMTDWKDNIPTQQQEYADAFLEKIRAMQTKYGDGLKGDLEVQRKELTEFQQERFILEAGPRLRAWGKLFDDAVGGGDSDIEQLESLLLQDDTDDEIQDLTLTEDS